jgi:Phage integrase family
MSPAGDLTGLRCWCTQSRPAPEPERWPTARSIFAQLDPSHFKDNPPAPSLSFRRLGTLGRPPPWWPAGSRHRPGSRGTVRADLRIADAPHLSGDSRGATRRAPRGPSGAERGAGFDDLRHTAASVWLASGADPKVVQRVLGHASASMTMDLYGHLVDANLWQAAQLVGGISGAAKPTGARGSSDPEAEAEEAPVRSVFWVEPLIGIEPMTYALRGGLGLSPAVHLMPPPLCAQPFIPLTSKVIHGRC